MKKTYIVSWTGLRRMGTSLRVGGPGKKEVTGTSAEQAAAKVLDDLRHDHGRTVLVENLITVEAGVT